MRVRFPTSGCARLLRRGFLIGGIAPFPWRTLELHSAPSLLGACPSRGDGGSRRVVNGAEKIGPDREGGSDWPASGGRIEHERDECGLAERMMRMVRHVAVVLRLAGGLAAVDVTRRGMAAIEVGRLMLRRSRRRHGPDWGHEHCQPE